MNDVDPISLDPIPEGRSYTLGKTRFNVHGLAGLLQSGHTTNPVTREPIPNRVRQNILGRATATGWSARRHHENLIRPVLEEYGSVSTMSYIIRIVDFLDQLTAYIRTQPPQSGHTYVSARVPKLKIHVHTDSHHVTRITWIFESRSKGNRYIPMDTMFPSTIPDFRWESTFVIDMPSMLGYETPLPLDEYDPLRFPVLEKTPLIVLIRCVCLALGMDVRNVRNITFDELLARVLPKSTVVDRTNNRRSPRWTRDLTSLSRVIPRVYTPTTSIAKAITNIKKGIYAFKRSKSRRAGYSISIHQFGPYRGFVSSGEFTETYRVIIKLRGPDQEGAIHFMASPREIVLDRIVE